jgi:hypothetical protein
MAKHTASSGVLGNSMHVAVKTSEMKLLGIKTK